MRIHDFHATLQQNERGEDLMSALRQITQVKDLKRLAADETTPGWIPWDSGFDQTLTGH
jgi:hypothetical protein